ncbi:MAG: hypothetical protein J5760_02135 [Clostridia bacterium]|nr:hypothetical protein [Clostridia bacterium]
MKTLKAFTCLILVFALVFTFAACGGKENGASIVGKWTDARGATYEFRADGTTEMSNSGMTVTGTYSIDGDKLTLVLTYMGSTVEKTGLFRLEGDTLITTELDGTGEDRLTRVTGNGSTSEAGSTDKAAEDVDPEQGVIDIEHYDYKSESLGVGVKLDESWNLRTTEELLALISATKFGDAIKTAPLVYDFYATKGLNAGSLVVIFENMVKSYGRAYDTDDYIDILRSSLKAGLESQGLKVQVIEEITRTVGGKELKGFYIEAVTYGITTYEYVLLKRCGDFMADITIGSSDKAGLDQTLAMFYGLN